MGGTLQENAHGIPKPSTMSGLTPSEYAFHQAMYNAVTRLQSTLVPPNPPSNLKVIPIAAGNMVQFSRSNADHYVVYNSSTPNFNDAIANPVGQAQTFPHIVGKGGVQQFYWLQGFNANGGKSDLVGPIGGMTLAQGTDANVPAPPPPAIPPQGTDQFDHVIQIESGETL